MKRYRVWNNYADHLSGGTSVYVNGLQAAKTTAKLRATTIDQWVTLTWHQSPKPDEGRKVLYLWQGSNLRAVVMPAEKGAR